jgi:hypothetical protein
MSMEDVEWLLSPYPDSSSMLSKIEAWMYNFHNINSVIIMVEEHLAKQRIP